jgi:hypothetical protein
VVTLPSKPERGTERSRQADESHASALLCGFRVTVIVSESDAYGVTVLQSNGYGVGE